MLITQSEGGMSMPDLQALIDQRIPHNRAELEKSHVNLQDVANFCEKNYLNENDKNKALNLTKGYAVQALASVAYQINTMARDLLDMLELQTEKVNSLTNQVQLVNQVVDIHKEKLARREIGVLTTNKSILKQPKIVAPAVQEPKSRYMRTPIDYSVLDGIGHGVRSIEPPRNNSSMISRAASTISSNPNSHDNYGVYQSAERTATLGRSALRSNYSAASDYRVPQIASQMSRQISHGSDFGEHLSSGHNSSNDYNSMYNTSDRYGTIRAQNMQSRTSLIPSIDGRNISGRESPTLPLPPPQIQTQHYGGYIAPGSVIQQQQDKYGTIRATRNNTDHLPPPPQSLLSHSTHEDICDDLPPPPESVSGASAYGVFGIGNGNSQGNDTPTSNNLFDVSSEWVPNGEYIEKALVLYDYEAEKADELTLRENAIVYVVRKNEDGWYEGVLDGVTGLFPGNYVQKIQ